MVEHAPIENFEPTAWRPQEARRGRGAVSNASGRFEAEERVIVDDGWRSLDDLPPIRTSVQNDTTRTIIARNTSPDLPFDRSINPYRGCEHGCIYCFARPTHAYLGLSPGLDFETKILAKPDAAVLLRRELAKPGYKPASIALGTNTDPYQPIERERRITRQVLEVLAECRHPVGIVTKSALVVRDIDILADMARDNLAKVYISVTTLDRRLARSLEPRAATPEKRLDAISQLAEAGIPVGVMFAPTIPGLNDHEMEAVLEEAHRRGAREAGYITLRLPLEIKSLWREWLMENYPDRLERVLKLTQSMHGGIDYRPDFGHRMTGKGPFAELIGSRFKLACARLGFNTERFRSDCSLFRPPAGPQLSLLF